MWRVDTADQRGRTLQVVGWHRFQRDVCVGTMQLHIDDRKSLMIVGYELTDTLIRDERPDALGAMLLCTQQIATRLKEELSVGDGCVEWQLDHKRIDAVHKLFPDFDRTNKPLKQLQRRGCRYLRKCP